MNLKENLIISAPFLPERARIIRYSEKGNFYEIEFVTETSGRYFKKMLTNEDILNIKIIQTDHYNVIDNPEDLFFYIEAYRIRLAYQFDPFLAINVSQIDPLPHQIDAVYHYILRNPKIRFLLADDPGAGKTIMAGLVIKELQYRHNADRILIVAPGHLGEQWQRELKEKFGCRFKLINRATINSNWGDNVWENENLCITSIDFIKQDEIKSTLASVRWDLIIIDEAHKMSAYKYGDKIDKRKRYRVGELLSETTNHLIFLTATPHRGDEENFRLFIDLLSPGMFANIDLLKESVANKDNPLFLRRLKEDLKDFQGKPLFPPRNVQTISFKLNDEEKGLYNAVTTFVQQYFDKAKERRNIAFALMILQRRLSSSIRAVRLSLDRRKKRLEEFLRMPELFEENKEELHKLYRLREDDIENYSESEIWELEKKLELLTIAENIDDVKKEIEEINQLIIKAREAEKKEIESKLYSLKERILSNIAENKLLIFTEFRDTLEYLVDKIKSWDYKVNFIHGGMNLDSRIEAEKEFKHNAQIMVATEAAGEGINLQFCSFMVNYDIPWNPNRLEQRMGRIHRYGQQKEVFIYNMVSKDTNEGKILNKLFEKLKKMKEALGTDRVFDIIGDIFPDKKLDDILKEAVTNQRSMEEILLNVEELEPNAILPKMEKIFLTSLATRHIDYSALKKESKLAQENKLVPEYIEGFFIKAFQKYNGNIVKKNNYYTIDSVPAQIKRMAEETNFKNKYGLLYKEYKKVIFDKDLFKKFPEAEFIAPGHPLLEAVNEKILNDFFNAPSNYAVFSDPENQHNGIIWFIECELVDGKGCIACKRVYAVYQSLSDEIKVVNSSILWDLNPEPNAVIQDEIKPLLDNKEKITDFVFHKVLLDFRQEILTKRLQESEIKKKYGLLSLEHLITESNTKLMGYSVRQSKGEKMDIVINNEKSNLESLEKKKTILEKEINFEKNITISSPKFIGAVIVITPNPKEEIIKTSMSQNDEIERIGMQTAINFELSEGRKPEDVSNIKGLGFDIRSYNKIGEIVRYIEVKARAGKGEISITHNEWLKAKRFGKDYWLYIVYDIGSSPKIKTIQDPFNTFDVEEIKEIKRFIISANVWDSK